MKWGGIGWMGWENERCSEQIVAVTSFLFANQPNLLLRLIRTAPRNSSVWVEGCRNSMSEGSSVPSL